MYAYGRRPSITGSRRHPVGSFRQETIAYCSARVNKELDDRKVPLMGVLGAFLFAAQMINFTIPATGSSGHLGGGLLLTVLLGPYAALLTIASVLMIQALFFADGGLLALGCNIFNLGVFPAFVAYPLLYRPLAGRTPVTGKNSGSIPCPRPSSALQLGAFLRGAGDSSFPAFPPSPSPPLSSLPAADTVRYRRCWKAWSRPSSSVLSGKPDRTSSATAAK